MAKNDAGGLKAMAKHAKSMGLQKLRYYCQMCQKQCRDENGFKCHILTENHLRQMQLFSENSDEILNEFSSNFKRGFLEILSHRHGTKRVEANKVYQEYIADKDHIHMNSTAWTSLTEFCKYLGKESLAVVDETENGWYVQFIDRDPRAVARQTLANSMQAKEMGDEDRLRKRIKAQIAAAATSVQSDDCVDEDGELTELQSGTETFRSIKLMIPGSSKVGNTSSDSAKSKRVLLAQPFLSQDDDDREFQGAAQKRSKTESKSSTSAIERLMLDEQRRAEALQQQHLKQHQKEVAAVAIAGERQEAWLHAGILVRITNESLESGKFFQQRGVVRKVVDDFLAEIELDDGALVMIDQQELETIIPKAGKQVLIVNGAGRGHTATLLSINADAFNCCIRVDGGPLAGRELVGVEYEDVCRLG